MIRNEVVNQGIDYIMEHIGEDIKIEDVAAYCHFSKFYFSRIFKQETGESLYAFIKRMKMDRSAFRIKVEKDKTITDIGLEFGYSPSNYSSAFKQHRNESPADFRKNILDETVKHPFFHTEENSLKTLEECNRLISIEDFPDTKVIYERRKGNYHDLGSDWCEFYKRYEKYITPDSMLIERTYDDPSITDISNCMYDICISVNDDCNLENTTVIQGGKYAVYHFEGKTNAIYAAYQSIFNVWLPQSNFELDDRYGFDIYRKADDVDGCFIIDFYFPVR